MKLLIPLVLALASAHPFSASPRQSGPSVTIQNGTIIGYTNKNVDSFKGIPFAEPPIGNRRLRPPVPLAASFGTINTTADGQFCPGASSADTSNPEDCLYLNVQRPAGTPSGAKLPVVAYIYGGSFKSGSTRLADATTSIGKAVSIGEPYMFVISNYRLSSYGFLGGKELSDEGSTNNGLRDQRLALQWIQENIGAFGGDPSKVTLWGESAGSISVLNHLLINGGNNQYKGGKLFRAALMSSGTAYPALPVRHPKPQKTFDRLVSAVGCDSASNKLTCLREVPFNTFAQAQARVGDNFATSFVPYFPRPDPATSFFPRSPEVALATGSFTRVPMIMGHQEDEGTTFTQGLSSVANSTESIANLLRGQSPELASADALAFVNTYPGVYPDLVTEGSPFRTGTDNEIYGGYKRISAIFGDLVFTLATRIALDSIAPLTPVYSYISTYGHGTATYGTRHGQETSLVLGGSSTPSSIPDKRIRYLSFWRYADPNYLGVNGNAQMAGNPNYPRWPTYNSSARQVAEFGVNGVGLRSGDYRQSNYGEMSRNYSRFSN